MNWLLQESPKIQDSDIKCYMYPAGMYEMVGLVQDVFRNVRKKAMSV